jgi:hypothetical protein
MAKAIRTARISFWRVAHVARVAGALIEKRGLPVAGRPRGQDEKSTARLAIIALAALGLFDQFRGGVNCVGNFLHLLGRQRAL